MICYSANAKKLFFLLSTSETSRVYKKVNYSSVVFVFFNPRSFVVLPLVHSVLKVISSKDKWQQTGFSDIFTFELMIIS